MRDVENIIEMNTTIWGMQNVVTNVTDLHTCPIGGVNLLIASVLVLDYQLLEFSGNMIGGTGIHIPVGVDIVQQSCR